MMLSLAFALLLTQVAYSQIYIDGSVWDASSAGPYIEIVPLARFGSTAYNVVLDYGQKEKALILSGNFITNEKGDKLEFRSPVDALNYMYGYGWDLVQVYTFEDLRRYVMKRGGK